MPQELLYGAQVRTGVEKMRGKGVAERVHRQSGILVDLLQEGRDHLLHHPLADAFAGARDVAALHQLLDEEVVPTYYDRDGQGVPVDWLARIRESLKTLGPRFSATRMLSEYLSGPYRGA